MTKEEIFNNCEIKIFDKNSLCIQNREFMFAYNQPDSVVKDEFKGLYRNFGGLQSSFLEDSPEYEELYNLLLECSEHILKLLFDSKVSNYVTVDMSKDSPFNHKC